MSQKRAHPTVIDDAIDKFKEMENMKKSRSDLRCLSDDIVAKQKTTNTANAQNHKSDNGFQENASEASDQIGSVERIITLPNRRFLVKVIEEGSERSTAVSPVDPSTSPPPSSQPSPISRQPVANFNSSGLLLPTTLIPNTQSLDADTRVTLMKELRDFQRRTSQVIDCFRR